MREGAGVKSEREILAEYLRSKGLKKTGPRFNILDVFLSTSGHISAYELRDLIKKRYPGIGFSTVYRTLSIFVECGLANEVNFGDGLARYEKAFRRATHGHLICSRCGRTEEFDSRVVENVQKQVVARHKYKPQGYRFEIYGLCSKCAEL
jgi:Fur family ferric uptake transcriptional regulator